MSDNFPNMPSDSALPDVGVSDPNNTAIDMDDSSLPSMGKTKVNPTDISGPSGFESKHFGSHDQGLGSNDSVLQTTMAPSGENSSGIPAAQSIPIQTFGDPAGSAGDFPAR